MFPFISGFIFSSLAGKLFARNELVVVIRCGQFGRSMPCEIERRAMRIVKGCLSQSAWEHPSFVQTTTSLQALTANSHYQSVTKIAYRI
jgi:hypothetical protein